jgi:DUF4097 and DUF4098 domain-containing protein YvlB
VRLERNGTVHVSNAIGDVTVVVSSTDDVVIESTKTSSSRADLDDAEIRVRTEGGGVRIETRAAPGAPDLFRSRIRVNYVIRVPDWAAVDVDTVGGAIRVTGIHGSVQAQTVSGSIVATDTPGVERLQSVSGSIDLNGASGNQLLKTATVSGSIRATNASVGTWEAQSVSGAISLDNVRCRRLEAATVSGAVSFSGELDERGRYEIKTFSGSVRFAPVRTPGFDVNVSSFSGSLRSRLGLAPSGDGRTNAQNLSGRIGRGGPNVSITSFSGDIDIGAP